MKRTSAYGSSYTVLHQGTLGDVLLRDEPICAGTVRVRIETPCNTLELPEGFEWKNGSPRHASREVATSDLGAVITAAVQAVS